ncbi:ABC transporter permease subunit [Spongisporangium articulatum]|uniref:ABC transporter permease subunit n=1 Tax=Spongisporangium articulatum TaxID=3362603 RepID=A0ABW8AL24_9ACTN
MTAVDPAVRTAVPHTRRAARTESLAAQPIRPIPLSRTVAVELRKTFDTRAGFWLLASIVIFSVLATGAVIIWAPDKNLTYETFASAFGFPMSVILPMIAILAVTSEWSQRSGLTTFTLVPHRGRVIGAKAIATLIIAVGSMLVAMAIGVVANVAGSAIAGVDLTWDSSVEDLALIVLGNIVGMALGFMLGVVVRHSAGAIVGYFVLSLVLPTLASLLAEVASWFQDVQPWVDLNYAQSQLFEGSMSAAQWAHLGATSAVWILLPLAVGLRLLLRSEIK